jgi:hypothetical protein
MQRIQQSLHGARRSVRVRLDWFIDWIKDTLEINDTALLVRGLPEAVLLVPATAAAASKI